MTQSDQNLQDVYARCDPAYLRERREAVGIDIHILARNACLSVGQVRELEGGGVGHFFYSEAIKRQAYRRVLIQLGETPPQANENQRLIEPPEDLDARLVPLDSIAAMSHRPAIERSAIDALQPSVEMLKAHKSTLGLFVLVILAFAGMYQYLGKHLDGKTHIDASTTRASSPVASHSMHMQSPIETAVTPPPQSTPAATTSTTSTTTTSVTSAAESEFKCAYSQESLPQWTPAQARKEGRYVYVVSGAVVDVCVVDGQKRSTLLRMKAGESQSVYGAAPWQISGSNLQKVKIYFQGGLVTLPQDATQALTLVETPITP